MKKLFKIILFLAAFLFYWNTASYIENRTEAEDAFEYALMVETPAWMSQKERRPALKYQTAEQGLLNVEGGESRGVQQFPAESRELIANSQQRSSVRSEPHPWLYHPHHLLYGSLMKVGLSGVQYMGWDIRALDFLILISSLSAAGTLLLFFQFCFRRFSLRPVSSLIAVGLLAASYGFWRYAAEAEIVLPASFLGLAALYGATDPKQSRRMAGIAVLFSIFAVLIHIMNVVVVFVAIPCFYLLHRRWAVAIGHVLFCGIGIASVFFGVYALGLMHVSGGELFLPVGLGSLMKALIALGQCIVSGEFILGFSSIRAFLSELFASRMLMEEFFLGARLSRPLVLFSLLTFSGFILLSLGAFLRAGWVWKNRILERNRLQLPAGIAAIVVVIIWFIAYAGLLLFIEPGNPELWIMGLIPFWLLVCGLVLLPLTVDNRLWIPFAALLLLFIHNGVAGIGVLGDSSKDYQYQKAKWILAHGTIDDVVITAGNPVFERYLRYNFTGQVIYLYDFSDGQFELSKLPDSDGVVYVLGDVFEPIASLRIRFPKRTKIIGSYATEIITQSEQIVDNEFGGIWVLKESD